MNGHFQFVLPVALVGVIVAIFGFARFVSDDRVPKRVFIFHEAIALALLGIALGLALS